MADSPKLYIDSCCFIDAAKHQIQRLPDTERAKDVWFLKKLLEASRDKRITAFTSTLTVAECTHADGDMSPEVKTLFNRLLATGQYVTLIQPTLFIAADARDLRWNYNIALAGADGLHVASALAMGCAEFLTTDERIKNQESKFSRAILSIVQRGVRVTRPSDTALLPSDYRQDNIFG